jgi:hypothetical protein
MLRPFGRIHIGSDGAVLPDRRLTSRVAADGRHLTRTPMDGDPQLMGFGGV